MIEKTPPSSVRHPPPQRLIRVKEVLFKLGVGKSTLYRMLANGDFPQPTELTPNWRAWPEHVVDDWIAARVQGKAALN